MLPSNDTSDDSDSSRVITVTQRSKSHRIIEYSLKMLRSESACDACDPLRSSIVLVAEGRATSKCVTCVEVIKARFPGLHQINEISSVEKLLMDGSSKTISRLHITLSMLPINSEHYGYQSPTSSS